ncbi:NACHT, LRR and PYD domains-containing protein 4A-like isoform X2 [Mesocricetus auratus]|uniref:NACHT, LRR and PYD domains-containing protein 4A-like isoform X2 n=1 Tax=Mesocricetus auratus TaxID=10036 RepID=A0ABM2WN30_MESAU|nr:NACHT, LRR and PYD domains-containing protein 4A-like isoform X2 [Mesocricetus auratus]
MASFFSDFGLMWYLQELNKKEFMKFKEVLKQEGLQCGLQQIPWMEVKKASREDLANLLVKYYEKKAWDVTLSIFQNINRNDLSERAAREIAGQSKIYQAHLKNKLCQDWSRKFYIPIQYFLKPEVTKDKVSYLQQLFISETTEKRPHTVLLKGVSGVGKTLVLFQLMLAWSEGLLFQDEFSYIFYLCCEEVKQLKTESLAYLMFREWSSPSASIVEIVSQPAKLLFIIDSLEGLNCDLTEPELELCDNWMEKRPVNILLSSLLRRKMLPESSLLIAGTPESFDQLEHRIDYTDMKTVTGFDENTIRMCFQELFQDESTAQNVFRLVREKEQLFRMCHIPTLCWAVATCLKNEKEKARDPASVCRCITSVYTAYILNLFIPKSAHGPSKKGQDLLRGLCSLAAEGMWTDKFVFNQEDLGRNGIVSSDISTLLNMSVLLKSKDSKNFYKFHHPSIQEFCAAVFYLVKSHEDHPSKDVQGIETLLFTFLSKVRVHWIYLGCFIFGLLHKSEQEKLQAFFGYQLSQEVEQKLCQSLEEISIDEDLWEQVDDMKLFYCLFEMENEAFVMQVMDFWQRIKFVAKNYSDLMVAAYCLRNCFSLQTLSFSIQDILQEVQDQSSLEKLLICWQDVCSVLVRSQQLHIIQVKDTYLTDLASLMLYNCLKHPTCTPRELQVNNVTLWNKNMFIDLLSQNHNLHHLDLNLTSLANSDVKLLFDLLNQEECSIEELHLSNCSLSEQCWDYLSDVLKRNKILKSLDISSNDLKDEGLKVLCKSLSLPDSALKSLIVERCLITTSGCQHLAEVLSSNQNLTILQVSNNKLQDTGVKLLCDAIKQPNCHLTTLGLGACELTGASCEDLASAVSQNKTLWSINLLQNTLDRSGLAILCEALKQHRCTMHVLRLRITDFDKETQELLTAEEEKNPYLIILSTV